jgi:hypothetical protein
LTPPTPFYILTLPLDRFTLKVKVNPFSSIGEGTMKDQKVVSVGFVLLLMSVLVVQASAAEFTSCTDVREYFKAPLPAAPYTRIQDLKKAVEVVRSEIDSPSSSCEDWVIERAFFEYGTALDEYSKTFPGDPQATQTWANAAAYAYDEHLDWFLNLDELRKNRLIRTLTKTQSISEEEFKKQRGTWLRSRIGNVLNSMGASFVRAQAHEELFNTYERYSQVMIEIFPNEVSRKWHKWLRAQPDFLAEKRELEIVKLIRESTDVYGRWEAFRTFLGLYIPANPSVKDEWLPVKRRIDQWLSQ